eukprot:4098949-Amphidinium_carterae.1
MDTRVSRLACAQHSSCGLHPCRTLEVNPWSEVHPCRTLEVNPWSEDVLMRHSSCSAGNQVSLT